MVQQTTTQMKEIQRDMETIRQVADKFIENAIEKINGIEEQEKRQLNLYIQHEFPLKKRKIVKKRFHDESNEEVIMNDPLHKFTVEVHNEILDKLIVSLSVRFEKNGQLFADLSCLSPDKFHEINDKGLPPQALSALFEKIKSFDSTMTKECLQDELLSLAKNWHGLKKSLVDDYFTYPDGANIDGDNEDEDEASENEDVLSTCRNCKNCAICVHKLLYRYNLYSECYKFLAIAYKYLLTISITQVSCERSFSKLKLIKTRLRSTLSSHNLNGLMLMSCEKFILMNLDVDEITDNVLKSSEVLRKELSLV